MVFLILFIFGVIFVCSGLVYYKICVDFARGYPVRRALKKQQDLEIYKKPEGGNRI
jgi:hypothetical protein